MTKSIEAKQLRVERDRFVALAFAAADVLVELDGALRVRYAAGATQGLFGREAEALVGAPLFDLIAEADRARLRAALLSVPSGARMRPIAVRLANRAAPPMLAAGYHAADADETHYLALSVETPRSEEHTSELQSH